MQSFSLLPEFLKHLDDKTLPGNNAIATKKQRSLLKKELESINCDVSKLFQINTQVISIPSPLIASSTIFTPEFYLDNTKINPVIDSPTLEDAKFRNSSHILLITCYDIKEVIRVIQSTLNLSDFVLEVLPNSNNKLLICWYDSKLTLTHCTALKKRFKLNREIIINLEFLGPTHPMYEWLSLIPKLMIFTGNHQTIYFVGNDLKSTNLNEIQLTRFTEGMTKIGCIEKIEFIQESSCFKCTFENIKTALTLCKIKYLTISEIQYQVFSNLSEINQTVTWNTNTVIPNNSTIVNVFNKNNSFNMPYNSIVSNKEVSNVLQLDNNINISDIKSGQDERLSLMIRNIPNRMTHNELENYIHATSYGKYDFLYLKMDTKNKCNVGYAFISFISPKSIIKFYEHMHNYRWHTFNSTKVCQLVYARVQGSSNLKRKFKPLRKEGFVDNLTLT